MNNGYKQATVAYKVSDGEPVDINGTPTRVSGRKQAIAVKEGFSNPNPSLYEIEKYFSTTLDGDPTVTLDFDACPIGELSPWVLDGGVWGMGRYWYNNRIWQTL